MAIENVVVIGIVIFVLGIGALITHNIVGTVTDTLVSSNVINSSSNMTGAVLESGRNVSNRVDYFIFGVFIAILFFIIITGYFSSNHPIFIFAYIIVIIISVVLSTILGNTWGSVTDSTTFSTTLIRFPLVNHLLTNLAVYVGISGLFGMFAMFAKPYFGGGGGDR